MSHVITWHLKFEVFFAFVYINIFMVPSIHIIYLIIFPNNIQ